MSNNPLTPEHIRQLTIAKDNLAKLERQLADMKLALVPIPPTFESDLAEAKKRVNALILVYGNKK